MKVADNELLAAGFVNRFEHLPTDQTVWDFDINGFRMRLWKTGDVVTLAQLFSDRTPNRNTLEIGDPKTKDFQTLLKRLMNISDFLRLPDEEESPVPGPEINRPTAYERILADDFLDE